MDTFKSIFDLELIITAIALIPVSVLIYVLRTSGRKVKNSMRQKAFKILDERFENGLIEEFTDIEIFLESVYREFQIDIPIAHLLEDYLTNHLKSDDKEQMKRRYIFLKKIIEIEYEESPFEDLPDEERRLFIGMNAGIKNNDLESIRHNLEELNSVITTRTRTSENLLRVNRWSVPLAIIGAVLSLIFGLLSLRTPYEYETIEKNQKEMIEHLDSLSRR